MNHLVISLTCAILIGLGATLTTDVWALFLKSVFAIASPNYCLVGRWLRTMPEGVLKHSNIAATPEKSGECTVGWIAHYMIGFMFAFVFVSFAGSNWLQHPTPIPPIFFGVVTVLVPFFIMQPSLGLGIAASKTPNPTQARLRSLMNHAAFGIGLYVFGLLVHRLLQVFAY